MTFDWVTGVGTATKNVDYNPQEPTLPPGELPTRTILAGEQQATFDIFAIGDTDVEGTETFQFVISQVINAGTGDWVGDVTIYDDDTTPKIYIDDASFAEPETAGSTQAVNLTVRLDQPLNGTVTFDWDTIELTGEAEGNDIDPTLGIGSDFDMASAIGASIAPLSMQTTIAVNIKGDDIDELDETFQVDLSNPSGADVGDITAIATIVDSDLGIVAPSNAAGVALSGTQTLITWTDNSSNETAFEIEQLISSTWTLIGTTNADTQIFEAAGPFAPSTTYSFRVRATNETDVSDYSDLALATTANFPAAPTGLTATESSGTYFTLDWDDNSDEDGYRVYRKEQGEPASTQIGFTPADVTSLADLTVISGPTYVYSVRAYNAAGESAGVEATATLSVLDSDDDMLTDARESAIGTDPFLYDTDGDLLSDGFEYNSNGALNPLVPDDALSDADGDGLSNLDEQIYNSNAGLSDSDGDGVSDFDEVAQGSNPNDSSDLGEAPDDDSIVNVMLLVGDWSGSDSERYDLVVGPIRHQATTFGEVEEEPYIFHKGESHQIDIIHRGSDGSTDPSPDYDYSADVSLAPGEVDLIIVEDIDDILRIDWYAGGDPAIGGPFYPAGKLPAHLHIPEVDLDFVDAGGVELADEDETSPGGFLLLNDDDHDDDGILEYLDSFVTGGDDDLAELVLRALTPSSLQNLPGDFKLNFPNNKIRVWKDRQKTDEVISNSTTLSIDSETTLYVEGIEASVSPADVYIDAIYEPGVLGSGFEVHGSDASDFVNVTVIEVSNIDIERKLQSGLWGNAVDNPISFVWSHDQLRWLPTVRPATGGPDILTHLWYKKPWADRDNESVPWVQFANGLGNDPVEANPGMGNWAINTIVQFDADELVDELNSPKHVVVAEIDHVEIVGVPDAGGQTNFSNNPANMGGGKRLFPGRNSPDANDPTHTDVKIRVFVKPAVMEIPLRIEIFDADDPTASTGPIDNDASDPSDNRGTIASTKAGIETSVPEGEFAVAEELFAPSQNPGDNYRIVAAARTDPLDLIEPLFKGGAETQGRLYRDDDNDNTRDANEPIIDENNPSEELTPQDKGTLGPVHTSPLLTVWRKLFVEVDSMGAPDPGENFTQDDPNPGEIPDPDTSALADAFEPAFIEVNILDDSYSQGDLPFQPRFINPGLTDMNAYAATHRQTSAEDNAAWTVYVLGIYELGPNTFNDDNDPDGENALLGLTRDTNGDYSVIPNEIIRDVARQQVGGQDQWTAAEEAAFRAHVVVHEIAHQFLGENNTVHSGSIGNPATWSVMTVHSNNAEEDSLPQLPTTFNDDDIDTIRDHGKNPNPRP